MLLVITVPVQAQIPFALFGKSERQSDNLKAFKKWNEMLEQYRSNLREYRKSCNMRKYGKKAEHTNRCNEKMWKETVGKLETMTPKEKLVEVNRRMNLFPYILDPINWSLPDYWSTPYEFFVKSGDCEDYAIAKYLTLKRLGVPTNTMRIVVLHDKNLGVEHAVLAVYESGKIYILDNQIKTVVEDNTIAHYQPIYSINEHHWWRHR